MNSRKFVKVLLQTACTVFKSINTYLQYRPFITEPIFRAKNHVNSGELLRISYINSCTKFVKSSFTNSRTNSHMNSYTKKEFMREYYIFKETMSGKSTGTINIIDLSV